MNKLFTKQTGHKKRGFKPLFYISCRFSNSSKDTGANRSRSASFEVFLSDIYVPPFQLETIPRNSAPYLRIVIHIHHTSFPIFRSHQPQICVHQFINYEAWYICLTATFKGNKKTCHPKVTRKVSYWKVRQKTLKPAYPNPLPIARRYITVIIK